MKKGLKGLFTASLAVLALGGLVACSEKNEEKTDNVPSTNVPTENKPTEDVVIGRNFELKGAGMLSTVQFDENGEVIYEEVKQPGTGKPVIGPDGKPIMAPKQAPELYNASLKGAEGSLDFKLELKSTVSEAAKTFKGVYEYFDGIGYKFTFAGSNEIIRSTYDKETKSHVIKYDARLGDLGKGGELKLQQVDDKFVISEEMLFVTSANFGFAFNDPKGFPTDDGPQKGIGFGLQLFPNGVCQFKNNHLAKLNQEGTYTYENDVFTINLKGLNGETVTAKTTNNNGVYTFGDLKFMVGENELKVNLEWNSNYYGGHGLSAITYPMGSEFKVTLTLNNDGSCLLDGESVNPLKSALAGMNLYKMFDRKGNWTYDAATKQYTIKYTDPAMMPGQESVNYEFTSTYDESKKEYSIEFQIGTAKGVLRGKDFGKDFTPSK